jgi:hypothetical protein
MYYGNIPFVSSDETYVLVAANPTSYLVVPFGEFCIFIGFTSHDVGFDSDNTLPH